MWSPTSWFAAWHYDVYQVPYVPWDALLLMSLVVVLFPLGFLPATVFQIYQVNVTSRPSLKGK
jgi:hypothetical protein